MIGSLRVHGVGGKMFRRLVAVVLVGEAFVFFFAALVAWATNRGEGQPGGGYLVVGCALALLCFLTAGLLRLHADRVPIVARETHLRQRFAVANPTVPTAVVPAMSSDVHDLAGLRRVGDLLAETPETPKNPETRNAG